MVALFGLIKDLDLKVGNRYSFANSIFYIGFIAGSYPAIVLAQRYRIERVAASVMVVWGITLMCTAAVHNYQGLYAQRFCLGFLESGIPPMFMLVVAGWYKKPEQAFRLGIWYSCTAFSSMISPLVNYGLGHIQGSLAPWRYMYIVAGSITIIWASIVYFFLPADPIRAKGFTERERYIAVARLRSNNSGVLNTHFKKEQVWEVLLDVKFWLNFSMIFLLIMANGPFTGFIPLVIASFGFNRLQSLLLVMPSGAVAGSTTLIATYVAYKVPRARLWIVMVCEMRVILSCLLLWLLPRSAKGGLLFATFILGSYGAAHATLMSLQIANTAGYTKRSISSSGIFIGFCCGNIVGPLLFKSSDAPEYVPGFTAVVAVSASAAFLAFVYRCVCVWENKERDRTGTLEAFENAYQDDLTDKTNPQFRYTFRP